MGVVDPSLLLSWRDVFSTAGLLVLLGGAALALIVAQRPHLFWPFLLVVNTFGNGPRVAGYVVLDELFTGFIAAGAVLRIVLTGASRAPASPSSAHRTAYRLFIAYMVCQALVGIIENADVRLTRWLLLYAVLGVASTIVYLRGAEFPFPPLRRAALILVGTSVAYYIAYLAQGMIGDALLGPFGRFLTQDYIWSGSAYAVLPTLVGTPAAVWLTNDRSRVARTLAWLALGLMTLVAFYYDSRLSWAFLIVLTAVSWRQLRLLRLTMIAALGFAAFVGFRYAVDRRLPFGGQPVATVSTAYFERDGGSDVGRVLHLRAALDASASNWRTAVVGEGIYSHRFVLVPYVKDLLRYYLPPQTFVIPGTRDDTAPEVAIIRTQGAVALLIDTGLIGVGLFLMNVALLLRLVVARRAPGWLSMVAVVSLAVLWLLTNNVLDIVMFHLLFMPAGFVDQWSTAAARSVEPLA